MRLIEDPAEIPSVTSGLPTDLVKLNLSWEAVERTCFSLCTDLLYFDVIQASNIKNLPLILRHIEEEKCFVFNHRALFAGGEAAKVAIALEISADCEPDTIARALSNDWPNHVRLLSVFYLVGDFGIVSPSGEWFIFARTDDHAIFTSKIETKYSIFNKHWWSCVLE